VAAVAVAVAGIGAGGTAVAAKKKGNKNPDRVRTFKNGQQLLIPDDAPGASFPGVLDATIRVGKAMKGREVADADVSVRITHPDTTDLGLFLIAPNGATVGLAFDQPIPPAGSPPISPPNTSYGSGPADCSGAMTTFDDETFNFMSGADLVNEPGEILRPWTARVEPQGLPSPLNIVDGGRARGIWTLRILDDTSGDVGTLNCFRLRLRPERR
jgi:hypothetical protein